MLSGSLGQTKRIARNLAKEILKKGPREKAVVVALMGELGSGKTVFAQGFAKALGVKENILSPTFVIERVYEIKNKKFRRFIHIDAYRINDCNEVIALDWKEIIADGKNIVLVEWAEKLKNIVPEFYYLVRFEHRGGNQRSIDIETINVL
jgi:tRNA threonylcarbamoyladenosine biosynthesis protein TsaE